MHEFSLCQSILTQVKRQAKRPLTEINCINIVCGSLSLVDIDSLNFWFPTAAKQEGLEHLKLNIIQEKAQAQCKLCSHIYSPASLYQECPACKALGNYTLLTGQELIIKSIE